MPKSSKTFALASVLAAYAALAGCATTGSTASARPNTLPASKAADSDRANRDDDRAVARASGKVDKKARAAIEREDLLTQMTFWAREQAQFPEDQEAALKFSEVLRKGGRAERAVEIAGQAMERNPENKDLLRAYGMALISAGRSAEALRPLALLAKADAKDIRARNALGVALDEQGRFDQARQAYKEALALKPDDAGVLTNLGVSYLLTGESAKAEEVLRQAAMLPDAGPETRQNLALAIGLQGRFGEAEQLQKVDLPPALVANNMAYLRGLLTDDRRWGDTKTTKKQ